MRKVAYLVVFISSLVLADAIWIDVVRSEPSGVIAMEVKLWTGDYASEAASGRSATVSRSEIWTVGTDGIGGSGGMGSSNGAGASRIVRFGDHAAYPQWSPDGKWLYFQSDKAGAWQIYRCRPDGSGVQSIVGGKGVNAYGYVLSSDGRQIAYASHPDSAPAGIAVALASGRDPRYLVRNRGYNYMPSFHPDGKRLAFASTRDGNYEIYTINLDGTDEKNLTGDSAKDFFPQWHPNGREILFFRATGETAEIYRLDVAHGEASALTTRAQHDTMFLSPNDRHGSTDGPAYSPDGGRIAYAAKVAGVSQVFVMNSDGTDARQVVQRSADCYRARWSSDGRVLSFVSWVEGRLQLFVCEARPGATARQITALEGSVVQAAWKPGPKR